jgi:hypothetical protein
LTVCVAARCNESAIFCAADRMVTIGDMEVESPTPKIVMLTSSIAIMTSDDDAAYHTEIITDAYATIARRITDEREKWWTVREVVDLYIERRISHKQARAERDILKPLGLNYNEFSLRQKTMDTDLVRQIAMDLVNYKTPLMSAIITGIDPAGAHIHIVHDGESGNIENGSHTMIGYAAIGAGQRHATAELLRASQSFKTDIPKTMWNVYLAKKRSEVAPGVGDATDVYMIGPALGAHTDFSHNNTIKEQLETVWTETRRREEETRHYAAEEMTSYVKKLAEDAEKPQAQTAPIAITSGESAQPESIIIEEAGKHAAS